MQVCLVQAHQPEAEKPTMIVKDLMQRKVGQT
jgi:hypothetical protein